MRELIERMRELNESSSGIKTEIKTLDKEIPSLYKSLQSLIKAVADETGVFLKKKGWVSKTDGYVGGYTRDGMCFLGVVIYMTTARERALGEHLVKSGLTMMERRKPQDLDFYVQIVPRKKLQNETIPGVEFSPEAKEGNDKRDAADKAAKKAAEKAAKKAALGYIAVWEENLGSLKNADNYTLYKAFDTDGKRKEWIAKRKTKRKDRFLKYIKDINPGRKNPYAKKKRSIEVE